MSENIEKMKDAFLSGYKENAEAILNYLREEAGIPEAAMWNYIGYEVVSVPPEKYELALREGKKHAVDLNIGMYWLDHYNVRRSPIASSDIGYGILPKLLVPGEEREEYKDRSLWGSYDDRTPQYLLEYFDSMKSFLGVSKIFRTYNGAEDALTITPLSLDYEEQNRRLKSFVERYGYGPFETIYSLSFTGELEKPPILVKK